MGGEGGEDERKFFNQLAVKLRIVCLTFVWLYKNILRFCLINTLFYFDHNLLNHCTVDRAGEPQRIGYFMPHSTLVIISSLQW